MVNYQTLWGALERDCVAWFSILIVTTLNLSICITTSPKIGLKKRLKIYTSVASQIT